MPKIICLLENASTLINGVKFAPFDGEGLISEELTNDQAETFLSIRGYELADEEEDDDNGKDERPKVLSIEKPAAVEAKETVAQRKARLKQEAIDAKAAEDIKAAEEADAFEELKRKAEEEAAIAEEPNPEDETPAKKTTSEDDSNAVF